MKNKDVVSVAKEYFAELEKEIIEYIENTNKENECIDLGDCESYLEALKKATEIVYERYPFLPKNLIYANMTEPDTEDFLPEDGEPTFIYKENGKIGIFMFLAFDINCGSCKHCSFDFNTNYKDDQQCNLFKKDVKRYDRFCEKFVSKPNYFGQNDLDDRYKPRNPYL